MALRAEDVSIATPRSAAGLRRTTWALAWPVIFSFSIESFVGLCDTLMVGRLGATAVAAVGVGVQILGAVDSVLFAVGTGALAIVARHVGAGETRGRGDAPSVDRRRRGAVRARRRRRARLRARPDRGLPRRAGRRRGRDAVRPIVMCGVRRAPRSS
jgi:hypothetical protein